jgi:hypothetical protein
VHWETPSWLGKLFWCQRRNVVFRVRDHGGEHGGVEKEAEGEDNLRCIDELGNESPLLNFRGRGNSFEARSPASLF